MTFRRWDTAIIVDADAERPGTEKTGRDAGHKKIEAIAPVIISASRATDIPAFYADWFMARFRKGYVKWNNPYSHSTQYVSFAKTRVIVFWSKNPREIMKYLEELDSKDVNYYFQFTLNDYEQEQLEPGLPPLDKRIETFINLAEMIGPERVLWRFDPLVLSNTLSIDTLISRIGDIGDCIQGSTRRFIFSYVDIVAYRKIGKNLAGSCFSDLREFTHDEKIIFAKKLQELNHQWNLELFTCGEEIDLMQYGILKGNCVDYNLMIRLFHQDRELMNFLRQTGEAGRAGFRQGIPALFPKDTGQRKECGCHVSKDIGQYNTCIHLCAYCYANRSDETAKRNFDRYLRGAAQGQFYETIIPD